MSKHPELLKENVAEFMEELSVLGNDPLLIALGSKTYMYLKKHLPSKYRIVQITHYAHQIGKEKYRQDVLNVLDSIQ